MKGTKRAEGTERKGKDEYIRIKNARIRNLKGIDVSISKHRLTVITGVSGGGDCEKAIALYEKAFHTRVESFPDSHNVKEAFT